jgi:hypothetical protein
VSGLSDLDRDTIDRARELAEVNGPAVRERTGETDAGMAYAVAFGEARHLLGELVAIIERPAVPEDTRRLAEIREMLSRFDWEHDDRQLALEAIERIAEGETDAD